MAINLKQLLDSFGADYVELNDDGMLGTNIGSGEPNAPEFPLAIHTWTAGNGREYVRLIITPFVEQPDKGYPPELSDTVLMINEQMPQAKFAFDEDEDLVLILEIDAESFDRTAFQRGFELLGAYAEYYHYLLSS